MSLPPPISPLRPSALTLDTSFNSLPTSHQQKPLKRPRSRTFSTSIQTFAQSINGLQSRREQAGLRSSPSRESFESSRVQQHGRREETRLNEDSIYEDGDLEPGWSEASGSQVEWKRRIAETLRLRSERRIRRPFEGSTSRSEVERNGSQFIDDETTPSSPESSHPGFISFKLSVDSGSSSTENLNWLDSPATSSSFSTTSNSPYASDDEFTSPCPFSSSRLNSTQKRGDKATLYLGEDFVPYGQSLTRRHTFPRHRSRICTPPSPLKSSVALPETVSEVPSSASLLSTLPHATRIALFLTLSISLYSLISPIPIAPVTPVYLLRPTSKSRFALDLVNSLFSPFLISTSLPSLVLGLAHLNQVRSLDRESRLSGGGKIGLALSVWFGTLLLRVTACYVFGRALGWSHSQLMSSEAIHEVGSGLAPLLLVLTMIHSFHARNLPSSSHAILLYASFAFPAEQGGGGRWFAYSALLVGLITCIALNILKHLKSPEDATSDERSASSPLLNRLSYRSFTLSSTLLIPTMVLFACISSTTMPTSHVTSATHLLPESPNLLTVLLMTAPRPGSPDFLLTTIDSWLSAFPNPDSYTNVSTALPLSTPPLSSRLRLVVYTHFSDHPQFDIAQDLFTTSKAQHYLTFHRDPRAVAAGNRLDQRLHVARALDFASKEGDAAYVLLTEDDFPLCEDPKIGLDGSRTYLKTMEKLEKALVETNRLLPDPASSSDLGHCGLFVATGGSGLAIRTSIASLLPSLLLGADDPQGYKREALAAQGSLVLAREGEGADTPDLVIQDCLRGRLPECSMCAPSPSFALPKGSARVPWGVMGDRYGKSGLAATERLLQRHLGYNASTLPGRTYDAGEWQCGWRQPFNGEPDILVV